MPNILPMTDTSDSKPIDRNVEPNLRQELLALGEALVARGIEDQELPDLIHQYSELFDSWFASANFSSPEPDTSKMAGEMRTALGPVLAIHEAVLALASRAKDLTEAELKSLRTRGKGILAYVDTMPKKVSLTRGRKG